MSKHRSTNEFPSYQQPQPDMPQSEKPKKKIGKGWKIAGGAVLAFAAIGIFAPTGSDDFDSSSSSATATRPAPEETTVDAPGDDLTEETTSAPEPTETVDDPTPTETAAAPAATTSGHSLTFEASTSDGSTGMVTYVGEDMNIIQHTDMAMPWSETIDGIDSDWDVIGANMSVQQNGSGEVTCRVLWDGEVVSENTSTGAYSIASCSLPTNL